MELRLRRSATLLSVVCILVVTQTSLFGQGTRLRSPYEPVGEQDADHPKAREQWFMRGRVIPGHSAAALRYRVHVRKMQMRAASISRVPIRAST